MTPEATSSRVARLIELETPPLNEPGPRVWLTRALLTERGACSDYGQKLLDRLGDANGEISATWSVALALWLAAREPAAADWLRMELGLAVPGQRSDLSRANLPRASLRAAQLADATLQGAYLWQANLEGADLQRADLRQTNLEGAYLFRANIDGAQLQEANLQQAHLRGVYLREAKLEQAKLWQADLAGASLQRTSFRGANLAEANLEGAWRDETDDPLPGWRLVGGRLVRA